jgi:hypothetical protein
MRLAEEFTSIDSATTQEERLRYIELRLYFVGEVNRADLIQRFGLKDRAASRDLARYKELAPSNLEYDVTFKAYVIRQGFQPIFQIKGQPSLAAVLSGFVEGISPQSSLISFEAPTQLNLPDIPILAAITRAIHHKKILEIGYRSLSSGLGRRRIMPIALVDNGLRWHLRAFDYRRQCHTDFVINRMELPINEFEYDAERDLVFLDDEHWNEFIDLEIKPHPRLLHPETIEKEYGMQNGILNIRVRAAVVGYVLRRWNVDCSAQHTLSGAEYHLCLTNQAKLQNIENSVLAPGFIPFKEHDDD